MTLIHAPAPEPFDLNNPTPQGRKSLAKRLISLGLTRGKAERLASGQTSPSIELAVRLEAELGLPLAAWPLRDAADQKTLAN